MNHLLSILIPSTPDRGIECSNLLKEIEMQCNGIYDIGVHESINGENVFTHYFHNGVTATVYIDSKILTIGEKRERLYNIAKGIFSWQIDSDDLIAPNAIQLILEAIKCNPEIPCITFRENCMINGEYKSSNHSIKYSQWMDNQDGFDYVRSPFYKDVIRTDIAQSVPFEHIRYNEDERWAKAIYPLLTSEIHIDKELYFYIYQPKETHEERYGLNRRD